MGEDLLSKNAKESCRIKGETRHLTKKITPIGMTLDDISISMLKKYGVIVVAGLGWLKSIFA